MPSLVKLTLAAATIRTLTAAGDSECDVPANACDGAMETGMFSTTTMSGM